MAHDTNHGGQTEQEKTVISFRNGFWLIVILVGVFIASLNFVQVMSKGEGEEGKGEKKEKTEHATGKEEGEKGAKKEEAKSEGSEKKEEAKPAEGQPKEAEHK